jgi:hypothetical protein
MAMTSNGISARRSALVTFLLLSMIAACSDDEDTPGAAGSANAAGGSAGLGGSAGAAGAGVGGSSSGAGGASMAGAGGSAVAGAGGSGLAGSGGAGQGGSVNAPDSGVGDAGSDAVTFTGQIQAILVANCSPCHSTLNNGGHNAASSYDDAARVADDIVDEIASGGMPESGNGNQGCDGGDPGDSGCVSVEDFALIQRWVQDGTPE